METVGLAIVFVALAMLGLGLGVLFGGRPVQGSCGGIAGACGWCGGGRCRRADGASDQGERGDD